MMTHNEITALIAMIVSNDKRTIGDADFALWSAAARQGDWTFAHARQAFIEFVTEEPDKYLRPGHITERIAAARDRVRVTWVRPEPPRELADDPRAEIDWIRKHRDKHVAEGMFAWADGQPIPEPAYFEIDNPKQGQLPAPRTASQRETLNAMRSFVDKTTIR